MTTKITARAPGCSCKARRWFECSCDLEAIVYEAEGHPWEIEDIGIPTPAFVAYVAALHPGWDLIRLPGPEYLSAEYAAALRAA